MRKEKRRVLAKPIATRAGRIRQNSPALHCTECAMQLLKENCESDKIKRLGVVFDFLIWTSGATRYRVKRMFLGHQTRL